MAFGSGGAKELAARQGIVMKEKYEFPTFQMKPKDKNLIPEEMLEVDSKLLRAAKAGEIMRPIKVRMCEDGPDRTLDTFTTFKKDVSVEGMSAQQTIFELRLKLAEIEGIEFEDTRLFSYPHALPDKSRIGECYVEWMGFGLEDWPPRCVCKPRVRGFEIDVDVPASRDISTFEKGRCTTFIGRKLTFDVETSTKVEELKELIAKRLGIPAKRMNLSAQLKVGEVRLNDYDNGVMVPLDNDKKTMADYGIDKLGVAIKFEKNNFDENGNYVFDDAYWDEEGYHNQPENCWIPLDSLNDRSRPDAQKADPCQPLSIITDRRQAEAKQAQDGE